MSTRIAQNDGMNVAAPSTQPRSAQRKPERPATAPSGQSHYPVEEIGAYIAVRDTLLGEAQKTLTQTALQRLVLANNFVVNCLRPARGPYLSQCLPGKDAARELKRCASVDASITKLRARLVAPA